MAKTLIVEDRAPDRKLLAAHFARMGYEVVQAADGAEGLRLAREIRPDLIISDVMMPKMDGFQLLREVRKAPEIGEPCFVIYSSVYDSSRDRQFALDSGADGFIVKPKEPEAFWSELGDILKECQKCGRWEGALPSEEEYLKKYSRVVGRKLDEKVRDLEEKEAEAERKELRYRHLFNSLRDAIFVCDPEGRIQDVNRPAFRTIFGHGLDEVKGHPVSELAEKTEDALAIPIDGSVVEKSFRRKGGEIFQGEISTFRLDEEAGLPGWTLFVVRDVTDRVRLRQQLSQTQMMDSIGLFAGGVAHDFNNLLTAILGYGELAQHRVGDDTMLSTCIEQIMAASQRAVDLTGNILAFSRTKAFDTRPMVINEAIEGVSTLLERILRENIELSVSVHPRRMTVHADRSQLDRILLNMAANARDAMPDGGRLDIVLRPVWIRTGTELQCGLKKPGRYAELRISDTGAGMEEATRTRIFEPFFTTKQKKGGTGLGLAMIYGIVRQHGGGITVESEPGRGTTFHIYFPLARRSRGAAEETTEGLGAAAGRGEKLLIVEDDDAVRQYMEHVLRDAGYTVIATRDGEQAIESFREMHPEISLVITDVILPKKNGKEVCEAVRRIKPGSEVIFTSGYTGEILAGMEFCDADTVLLRKPLSRQELLSRVREMLDRNGRTGG